MANSIEDKESETLTTIADLLVAGVFRTPAEAAAAFENTDAERRKALIEKFDV
jgi:hypothetical protein